MRRYGVYPAEKCVYGFPFLLGGTFIEANESTNNPQNVNDFPSFWEGLSLRLSAQRHLVRSDVGYFPSFWEGLSLRPIRREQREQREGILRFQAESFIEASPWLLKPAPSPRFLRFLAETFIEACRRVERSMRCWDFPSFWEGLSLRHRRPTGASMRTHALSETGVYYEIFSLSGETCIKAQRGRTNGEHRRWLFPYSFVGTFIETSRVQPLASGCPRAISLPFG